jgi:hypothetical protein
MQKTIKATECKARLNGVAYKNVEVEITNGARVSIYGSLLFIHTILDTTITVNTRTGEIQTETNAAFIGRTTGGGK